MNLDSEKFREVFNDFKRGNFNNIYIIIDSSLFIVVKELNEFKDVSYKNAKLCLIALINSINDYSYEKFATFENYVKAYTINYLYCQKEQTPSIIIEKEEEYINKIVEYCKKNNKDNKKTNIFEKNTTKILLLSKKNGIL